MATTAMSGRHGLYPKQSGILLLAEKVKLEDSDLCYRLGRFLQGYYLFKPKIIRDLKWTRPLIVMRLHSRVTERR
jgi:c-di-GMP-related signal transduction protein